MADKKQASLKKGQTEKRVLSRGYTTGACAQAAVRAAALSMATGMVPREESGRGRTGGSGSGRGSVHVRLPNGEAAIFQVEVPEKGVALTIKYAGDDPDVTDGAELMAQVARRRDGRIYVDGGEGVGRVTLEGLPVKPGRPAINPVPLRHIRAEAREVLEGGAAVMVSVAGGENLAGRTFNPRLGIEGGISILGTTGRVEPWSAAAYREALLPQLNVALAAGIKKPALVPGGKGERAARKAGFAPAAVVQVGNHFGFMLEAARQRGFKEVALIGHASKLLKLARGDFDTHSRRSTAPLDVLSACAAATGWSQKQAEELKLLVTTEAALKRLKESGAGAALDEGAWRAATAVREFFSGTVEVMLTNRRGEVIGHGKCSKNGRRG